MRTVAGRAVVGGTAVGDTVVGNRRVREELGDEGVTSTETRRSWSDRLSPRNWSLAWKLVAVGLVPALLAVSLGVLRVADQARTASDLGTANRLLEIRDQVAATGTALRAERDRATVFLAERRAGDPAPLSEAAARTDAAAEKIRTALGGVELDAATRAAQERADGGLSQLSVLRGGVTGTALLLPGQVVQRYTTVIDRVDGFDRALLRAVRTPGVAGLADALTAVTAAQEALALQHTVLGVSLRNKAVSPDDKAAVGVTDGAYVSAFGDYQLALPASVAPTNFVTSENNAQRDAAKSAIVLAPTLNPSPVTPAAWDAAVAAAGSGVDKAGVDVATALTAAGKAAEARASNLAGVNSVLLMLGLLLGATIVVLVARSLTRSLRVLRSSALDVAQRRLPQAVEGMRSGSAPDVTVEPVPLPNRDEVGQVARAFDAVHGQALRLAADQAALQANVSSMFVNLSRRSQGLVERQLQLIENLESNEQDPDQLSNLFQLDHLATRMRRNSENLLVLAGTDFAKRNVAPVPLVDVLRAAVSEIEHYQRILVQAPPPATIIGRATSDVVHLLAELLDNATNFSPPDSQVVMSSMRAPDGSIVVEIADRGVGMLDQELTDANRRLGTPSAVDVSASRRMGLFVVGRLGARHGITVHLGGSRTGGGDSGLTASVTLPARLVVSAGGDRPDAFRPQHEPAPAVNGVPPQRPGQGGRPTPRPALATPGDGAPLNGQPRPQPVGINGLPTRTPGSALRRSPVPGPAAPAEPAGPPRDQADTGRDGAERPDLRSLHGRPLPFPPPDTRERGDAGGVWPGASAWQEPTGPGTDRPGFGHTSFDRPGADRAEDAYDRDGYDDRDGYEAADEDRADQADDRVDAGPDGVVWRADRGVDEQGADEQGAAEHEADEQGADEHEADEHDTGEHDTGEHDTDGRTADEHEVGEHDAVGRVGDEHGADEWEAAEQRAARGEVDERTVDGYDTDGYDTEVDGRDADDLDTERQDAGGPTDGADALDTPPAGQWREPEARPTPGTGSTRRDLRAPVAPYAPGRNGAGRNGAVHGDPGQDGPQRFGPEGFGPGRTEHDGSPPTTPLPLVPQAEAPAADPADVLFSASVPAIAEPDGLPRSRRSIGDLRRGGPVDLTETTPIFEEIASAWFASQRPVPVDWEQGRPTPAPVADPTPVPAAPRGATRRDVLAAPSPSREAAVEAPVPASAFATVADEGWRAASGAAAERPDELTAAGLPKRRPRARLVPGSAGSAVLAAPASPSRSAESVRGRLASYQQGVRQGREVRLRRDPGGAGPEPVADRDTSAAAEGGHDEDNR